MKTREPVVLHVSLALGRHPFRSLVAIAGLLVRWRIGSLLVLPVSIALGLTVVGTPPTAVAQVAGIAFLAMWLVLTLHEYSHVALAIRESAGFDAVSVRVYPTHIADLAVQARWLVRRINNSFVSRGWPVLTPKEELEPPPRGYVRVESNMLLSGEARMRIALAGVVIPVLAWICLGLLWAIALMVHRSPSVAYLGAAIVGGLSFQVVHVFFSGVVYTGKQFSDLGYASAYLLRDVEFRQDAQMRYLGTLGWRILRHAPRVIADVIRFSVRPNSVAGLVASEGMHPKRTCFSWIYERDSKGEFGESITLLAPLGLALTRAFSTQLPEVELKLIRRLTTSRTGYEALFRLDRIYSVRLNPLASRAWELADGRYTVHEIATLISQEKTLSMDDVLPALIEFFRDLHRKYLVNLNWPARPARKYPSLSDVAFEFGGMAAMFRRMFAGAASA